MGVSEDWQQEKGGEMGRCCLFNWDGFSFATLKSSGNRRQGWMHNRVKILNVAELYT